jgi:hypothetical protein
MIELPEDVIIYGFAFTDDLGDMDMSELHEILLDRGVSLSSVVFSVWDDVKSYCTWIVAADRYLKEEEVEKVIAFIVENNIEEEYCLIQFVR